MRRNDINQQMRTLAMELTPDEMHIIVQHFGSGVARE